MTRRFVDTSAWIAFVNPREPGHEAVRAALEDEDASLVTSTYVLDEAVTLVKRRLGAEAAIRLGAYLRSGQGTLLLHPTAQDEANAWRLFTARQDKPYSMTDCVSFVLMRNLAIGQAIALDEDFHQEGFEVLPVVR